MAHMQDPNQTASGKPATGKRGRAVAFALIIIGLACILYGVTVMLVGSGSLFFAFWYVLGAALIAVGWAVASGFWDAMPLICQRAVQVIGALFAAFVIITHALIFHDFNDRGEPDLDCVIVLGAQVRETGLSVALKSRLDTAYDYLVENEGTRCIVSGGQGANEPIAEADAMYAYLVERGISPERITREDASVNTSENIRNSLRYLDAENERVGIVSNNYHLFRALALARKQGIVHASGLAAGATPWYIPNNTMREAFGLVKDFAFGNL